MLFDFITAPLVIGICVYGIYKLFELYARRRERIMLIEKLGNIPSENLILPTFSNFRISSYAALKGGCLLVGLGLGVLIGYVICGLTIKNYVANLGTWENKEISGIIYGACVLLFGGIGLLTSFIIELNLEKKKKQQ